VLVAWWAVDVYGVEDVDDVVFVGVKRCCLMREMTMMTMTMCCWQVVLIGG
jgi:hypothetical protein